MAENLVLGQQVKQNSAIGAHAKIAFGEAMVLGVLAPRLAIQAPKQGSGTLSKRQNMEECNVLVRQKKEQLAQSNRVPSSKKNSELWLWEVMMGKFCLMLRSSTPTLPCKHV